MNRERTNHFTIATAIMAAFVLLAPLASLTPSVSARSITQQRSTALPSTSIRDEIIARAKTWVDAHVPYNQRGLYQGYREDCSGLVSMAWGLTTPGLTTYTLPTVAQPISKDELQPGDVLNNQSGGGNSDFAHVLIFDSWVDSEHTHYNAYEENPYWGGAHYTQNIPYPFWPAYYNSQLDYTPLRFNSLVSTPPTTVTPAPTVVPMPPTRTDCPAVATARAAVTRPLGTIGTEQNVVYVDNQGTEQSPTDSVLKRYDVTTGQTIPIVQMANTWISEAQISADGQWILFVAQVVGQDAIQMVRIDGRGLQTLHCAPGSQNIYALSWSPDQRSLVFNEGMDIYTSSSGNPPNTYLLDIASGTLQSLLVQPPQDPNQVGLFLNYIPSYWIDNTRLYMIEYVRCCGADQPFRALDLLDTTKGTNQQVSDLSQAVQLPPSDYFGYALSPDRTQLFFSQCYCGFAGGAGPSTIAVQSPAGGPQRTIFTNSKAAITGIYTISSTRMLFLVESYANAVISIDTSQNGVWEMNADGTNQIRLTTEHYPAHTILNSSPDSWANFSRDGNLYAAQLVQPTGSNSVASTLYVGFLNESASPINITTVPATDFFDTPLSVVGWATM